MIFLTTFAADCWFRSSVGLPTESQRGLPEAKELKLSGSFLIQQRHVQAITFLNYLLIFT